MYPAATRYWSDVYQILFISYLGISVGYIYGTLLTANESIRSMNYIFLGGVILNFSLNLIFIFLWKAWGAALATVITQTLTSFFLLRLATRELNLSPDPTGWFKLGIYTMVVYLFSIWTKTWDVSLILALFSVAFFSILCAWRLGLVRPKDWVRI